MKLDLARPIEELCRELSRRHPSLVFWKHLERGLSGEGDIDALCPAADREVIVRTIGESAWDVFPGLQGIVTCRHRDGVAINLLAIEGHYPDLLEFDLGTRVSRLGLEIYSPEVLVRWSEPGDRGIRIPKAGVASVVLILLNLIRRERADSFAEDDRLVVLRGLREDRSTAAAFLRELELGIDPGVLTLVGEALSAGRVPDEVSSKLWRRILTGSFRHHLGRALRGNLSDSARMILGRFHRACEVERTVVQLGRKSGVSLDEFLGRMALTGEQVLRERLR